METETIDSELILLFRSRNGSRRIRDLGESARRFYEEENFQEFAFRNFNLREEQRV